MIAQTSSMETSRKQGLICESVSFKYPRQTSLILNEFSHCFGPGISFIKGASGCGKSTLLRLLAGYLKPTAGRIVTPSGVPSTDPLYHRRDVGYVFQQLNLLPLATVRRNLQLAASLAGLSASAIEERVLHWLGMLGLEEFSERRPNSLSGGQQQRAAIARALIKGPPVLLLDEPTSGLDDLNTQVIAQVLADYVRSGSGSDDRQRICVICSHDSRLQSIAHEVIDFNCFLPLEGHLVALAGAAQ